MSPRKRKKINKGLPTGWRWRGKRLYYMVPKSARQHWDNKTEFPLGGSLSEAYKTWAIRLGEQDRGTIKTFTQLCDRFVLEHIPSLSPKAQESYQLAVTRIRVVYGPTDVSLMTQEVAKTFHAALVRQKSVATAKSTISVLKTMMSKAAEWGAISTNPLLGMRFESAGKRERYIQDWEIQEILKLKPSANNSRGTELLLPYVKLKLMTGLRRGDLLRLKLSDLKDDGIHVQPHKTRGTSGKRLVFLWNDDLRAVVRDIQAIPPRRIGDAPLFVNRKGMPYITSDGRANGFDSVWRRFVQRVITDTEVDERFQEKDIRAKVGSDAKTTIEAQEMLGHSSPAVTEKHYRRKPTVIKTPKLRK